MHTLSIGRAGMGRPKGAERGNTTNYGLGLKQGRGGGGRPTDFPLIYRHGPRLSTQHAAYCAAAAAHEMREALEGQIR